MSITGVRNGCPNNVSASPTAVGWVTDDSQAAPTRKNKIYHKRPAGTMRRKFLQLTSTNSGRRSALLRPFLLQSDFSVENGRFRLKPQSGFVFLRLDPPVEKLSRKSFAPDF